MVGHQHVSVELAVGFLLGEAELMQVAEVVLFGKKARFAIMAALHDVQGDVVEVGTWAAGHTVMLPEFNRP
jgi:hypothetical protein